MFELVPEVIEEKFDELVPEVIEEKFEEIPSGEVCFFFYFYFLRTPLVDSKYQWIGMKLMKVPN